MPSNFIHVIANSRISFFLLTELILFLKISQTQVKRGENSRGCGFTERIVWGLFENHLVNYSIFQKLWPISYTVIDQTLILANVYHLFRGEGVSSGWGNLQYQTLGLGHLSFTKSIVSVPNFYYSFTRNIRSPLIFLCWVQEGTCWRVRNGGALVVSSFWSLFSTSSCSILPCLFK